MKSMARILFLAVLAGSSLGWAAGAGTPGPFLNGNQWDSVLAEFEGSVQVLSKDLDRIQTDQKKLDQEIKALEGKIADLRGKAENGANVLDEIRLKGLLNDLKEKLVRKSDLDHHWAAQRKELEQKGLSLIALYQSRIEDEMRSGKAGEAREGSEKRLGSMEELAKKRAQVQALLARYPQKKEDNKIPSLESLPTARKDDPESLQLTLDLLKDRKREVQDRLEKLALEEEEIRDELKLQARMQDFLEDLRRQNQDSGFTGGGMKGEGLEGLAGKSQRNRLGKRLDEIRDQQTQAKAALEQINRLTSEVQARMPPAKKGGR